MRGGVVTVTAVLDPTLQPPRVAFALGRRVGSAVVRNRVRRRLRAALAELACGEPGVPGGLYLIGAGPEAASASFGELREGLEMALSRLRGQ